MTTRQDGFEALGRELNEGKDETPPEAPRIEIHEQDDKLVVRAEVPGVRPDNLQVALDRDVLEISAHRSIAPPAGHVTHRRERRTSRFEGMFRLPDHVLTEEATATLENGILELVMPRSTP
jgi:HSP20 family protein